MRCTASSATTVLLAGPLPPPVTGQAVGVKILLSLSSEFERYRIVHVDMSFEGKSKVTKAIMTLRSIIAFSAKLVVFQPRILHLMVSRSALGCFKDCVMINISRLLNIKTVVHVRGGDMGLFYDKCTFVLRQILKVTYRRVDCAIALGDALKAQFNGLVRPENIRIVPNCYEQHGGSAFSSGAHVPKRTRELRILFLSNVLPSKGLFDAVAGVAIARERGAPVRFTFAGQFLDHDSALARNRKWSKENSDAGKLERQFRQQVGNLDLEGHVYWKGVVCGTEKWDLLSSHDILVLPIFNPTEGQPLTVIEAMRAGCVVISTTCGGLKDLVEDGVTGTVVRPQCPEDIAEALEYYWNNPRAIREIGAKCQARAVNRHSPESHVRQITAIYDDLLHNEPDRKQTARDSV